MKKNIILAVGILLTITVATSCAQNKVVTNNTKQPITVEELNLLKKTLLWTEEDEKYRKMAGSVLETQLEDILDVWYGYVGANPHLVYYFNSNDKPSPEYLAKVRGRFKQWILDVCYKPFDKNWLEYQNEIGLRHNYKKGQTDNVENTPSIVNYRYMVAFIYPITVTIKPFLSNQGHSQEEVEKMYNAWFKAIVLSDILWTKSYIKEGQF